MAVAEHSVKWLNLETGSLRHVQFLKKGPPHSGNPVWHHCHANEVFVQPQAVEPGKDQCPGRVGVNLLEGVQRTFECVCGQCLEMRPSADETWQLPISREGEHVDVWGTPGAELSAQVSEQLDLECVVAMIHVPSGNLVGQHFG